MPSLDKIIHERARLLILTHLASHEKRAISFSELQDQLDLTSGNLSVQLKRLSQVGYVDIKKTFRDNKPYTTVSITSKGTLALHDYLDEMEGLIKAFRK